MFAICTLFIRKQLRREQGGIPDNYRVAVTDAEKKERNDASTVIKTNWRAKDSDTGRTKTPCAKSYGPNGDAQKRLGEWGEREGNYTSVV